MESRGYLLKYLLGCVFVLCSTFVTMAQGDVSFAAQAPRQVIAGNKFSVTYVLKNGDGVNLKYDSPEGIVKLYGPSISTSQSYNIINGQSSSSKTVEYTITYRASDAGKYTIPEASIEVNGTTMKSKPVSIEVLEQDKNVTSSAGQGASAANNSARGGRVNTPQQQMHSSDKEIGKDDVFVRIVLSKGSVYEQEAVVCAIKLYSKFQSMFYQSMQPTFDGCLIEEISNRSNQSEMEHYNGSNYYVHEIKKCILFPQKSGEIVINSGTYDVTVTLFDQYPSIFGYVNVPVERKIVVKSNQATIKVKQLPEPRPVGFLGAVGSFSLTTDLNSTTFRTGEAATLMYDIKGTGNIKYLKNPVVEFPSQFDVYDPQSNIDTKVSGANVVGTDKINYTFVPLYAGDYEIETYPFVYFNPSVGEYVTIDVPNYSISVKQGAGSYSSGAASANSIKKQNVDIRHIVSGDLSLRGNHNIYVVSAIYWLWYIVPIILFIVVLVIYRKTIKERANIQMMKTKKAGKMAKRKLKRAKAAMLANDSSKFYDEVLNAMWGYISDKLGIPVSMLNKENVAAELSNYGADEVLVETVLSLLDSCEFAQYTSQGGSDTLDQVYDEVSNVMNKIEGIKRK